MQPVSYLQTDSRWKNVDYSAPGESTTIGRAGCGPTCMAMVIATLFDPPYTPVDACDWAKAHGYKAKNQGTYYSYFAAHGKVYELEVEQVNGSNLRNLSAAKSQPYHQKALEAIEAGDWVVACMGPGTWTSGGHYILWWGIDEGKYRINDPASTKTARTHGDPDTFRKEVKYYWIIRLPKGGEEELTQEQFNTMMDAYLDALAKKEPSDWSGEAREWAEKEGIIAGDGNGNMMYRAFATREHMIVFIHRLAEKLGL